MDTTIKKVSAKHSPQGEMGQIYLVSGKKLSMRMWQAKSPEQDKPPIQRDYETIGYVIAGRAELHLEGQMIILEPGDSWLVPAEAAHTYHILESFTAVEATSPPARIQERDAAQ